MGSSRGLTGWVGVLWRVVLGGGVLLGVLGVGGCSSGAPIHDRPDSAEGAYGGPQMRLEEHDLYHVVVATVPTGGWQLRLDGTWEDLNRRSAYVSLIRPDPSFLYAQQVVEIRLSTEVQVAVPLTLYARMVDFADPNPPDVYGEVALDKGDETPPE